MYVVCCSSFDVRSLLLVVCYLSCSVFLFVCGVLSVAGRCVLFGVWCGLHVAWSLLFVVCMLCRCVLCVVWCVRFDVCYGVRSLFVVCCLLVVACCSLVGVSC